MWKNSITIVPNSRALFLDGSSEPTKELSGVVKINLRKETTLIGLVVTLRGEETFCIRKTGKKNKTETFLLEEHLRTARFTLPKGETEIPFTLRLRQDLRDSIAKFKSSSNFTGQYKHYLDYFLTATAHSSQHRQSKPVELFITQSRPAPEKTSNDPDRDLAAGEAQSHVGTWEQRGGKKIDFTFVAPTSIRADDPFTVRVYPGELVEATTGVVTVRRDTGPRLPDGKAVSPESCQFFSMPPALPSLVSDRDGRDYWLIKCPAPHLDFCPVSQTVRNQSMLVTYNVEASLYFRLPNMWHKPFEVKVEFEIELLPPAEGIFCRK